MINKILISSLVFIMILTTALFASWLFILERLVIEYFTHVEINPAQFETNFNQALEVAEFDFSIIDELGLSSIMPYINAEVAPIGELIIPSVDIHLPIFHGVTEAHISLGAATLTPDGRMGVGNYALASHYMPWDGLLFGSLHLVQLGDLIILRDDTYLYLYEAISNEVIEAYLVEIIDEIPDKTLITLITCTPDGLMRVAVQGEFKEQILISDLTSGQVTLDYELATILETNAISFPWFEVISCITLSLIVAGLITKIANKKN